MKSKVKRAERNANRGIMRSIAEPLEERLTNDARAGDDVSARWLLLYFAIQNVNMTLERIAEGLEERQ